MKRPLKTMNLKIFGESDKDFFNNAYNSAYNIGSEEVEDTDISSEVVGEPESVSNEVSEEIPGEPTETPQIETQELTPEQIKELYEKHFQPETPQEPELNEELQNALELYKYLEENPHLVQAMREVDPTGYQQLNNHVPDELTRKVQELEEFIQEQKFNTYISELKTQYKDFDEDKVIEFAEQHEIYDLEIAYKALKADSVKPTDEQALREQIKKEIMEELKNNSIATQTIIGSNTKPIEDNTPSLSARELRIAKAMGMSNEEYAKWR